MTVNINFPLSDLKNTLCALDKSLLFNDIIIIRWTWQSANRIAFNLVNPGGSFAGTYSAFGQSPATGLISNSQQISINNLQLNLAVETSANVCDGLKARVNSPEGLSLLIPYNWNYMSLLAGQFANANIRFNAGNFAKLCSIVSVLTNNNSLVGATPFDNSNVMYNAGVPNIFYNVYSTLNNDRLQAQTLQAVTGDIYKYPAMQKHLKGSVLGQSSNMFDYHCLFVDSWCSEPEFVRVSNGAQEDGLTMDENQIIYGINYQLSATSNTMQSNLYTFGNGLRVLTIYANRITVE